MSHVVSPARRPLPGGRRGRTCRQPRGRSLGAQGFTLVELIVTAALVLLVAGLVPPLFETATTATTTARGTAAGSEQASLALQSIQNQVTSAIQVCAPAQLTNPPAGTGESVPASSTASPPVQSSFALRVEQIVSPGVYRWEQWQVDTTSATIEEEIYVPGGGGGNWVTVAKTIYNASTGSSPQWPFVVYGEPDQGQPQEVVVNLYVSEQPGRLTQRLDITSAVSALDSPYYSNESPSCSTTSAAPTS